MIVAKWKMNSHRRKEESMKFEIQKHGKSIRAYKLQERSFRKV